jgi:hypothetical protein
MPILWPSLRSPNIVQPTYLKRWEAFNVQSGGRQDLQSEERHDFRIIWVTQLAMEIPF